MPPWRLPAVPVAVEPEMEAGMTVQRYRRKPEPGGRDDQFAACYQPGQPLGDLTAVARMADPRAELAEVAFPSRTVLVVRWLRIPDDHPSRNEYEVIEAGKYLAYSPGNDHLYETGEGNWRQFYDLVPEITT